MLPFGGFVLAACPSDDPVSADTSGSTTEMIDDDSDDSDDTAQTLTTGDSSSSGALDSTGGTDPSPTTGSTSSDEGLCGNGVVEDDEQCDDFAQSSRCDADCTFVECGDGVVNNLATEVCDGDDLLGITCATLGYSEGTLLCDTGCETFDTGGCVAAPELMLSFSAVKQFDFAWEEAPGAEFYRLYQSVAPGEPFLLIGDELTDTSLSLTVSLPARYQASYYLSACNMTTCADSAVVDITSWLGDAVGYIKASNTNANDYFGRSVSLSADGTVLAVAASGESSAATGVNGDQADNSNSSSGAVYVFTRDAAGAWSQHSYLKASNPDPYDGFGQEVALSADGTTIAVGAMSEDSAAAGINGDQADNTLTSSGAVYVFTLDGMGAWSQQAYLKASNPGQFDSFGIDVALSADGNTLAVGASGESSAASGVNGDQADDSAFSSGATYVFTRDGAGSWSQQAYLKASNPDQNDGFGLVVALSADGDTLATGAAAEDSAAAGVDGDQADNSASTSGSAYVFTRDGAGTWSQQSYLKASNCSSNDRFGRGLALSADGLTLAVAASREDSGATNVDGDQDDNSIPDAGAVYVFAQDAMGQWSQQAYVKASNPDSNDHFGGTDTYLLGSSVALSEDGSALAVGAVSESSTAIGLGGDQTNNIAYSSGAVYTFTRDGAGTWASQAYIKAPNTDAYEYFGYSVAYSADSTLLVVGAIYEASNATGIGGNQGNNSANSAGAVFLY